MALFRVSRDAQAFRNGSAELMIVRWLKGKRVYLPGAAEMLSRMRDRRYLRWVSNVFQHGKRHPPLTNQIKPRHNPRHPKPAGGSHRRIPPRKVE